MLIKEDISDSSSCRMSRNNGTDSFDIVDGFPDIETTDVVQHEEVARSDDSQTDSDHLTDIRMLSFPVANNITENVDINTCPPLTIQRISPRSAVTRTNCEPTTNSTSSSQSLVNDYSMQCNRQLHTTSRTEIQRITLHPTVETHNYGLRLNNMASNSQSTSLTIECRMPSNGQFCITASNERTGNQSSGRHHLSNLDIVRRLKIIKNQLMIIYRLYCGFGLGRHTLCIEGTHNFNVNNVPTLIIRMQNFWFDPIYRVLSDYRAIWNPTQNISLYTAYLAIRPIRYQVPDVDSSYLNMNRNNNYSIMRGLFTVGDPHLYRIAAVNRNTPISPQVPYAVRSYYPNGEEIVSVNNSNFQTDSVQYHQYPLIANVAQGSSFTGINDDLIIVLPYVENITSPILYIPTINSHGTYIQHVPVYNVDLLPALLPVISHSYNEAEGQLVRINISQPNMPIVLGNREAPDNTNANIIYVEVLGGALFQNIELRGTEEAAAALPNRRRIHPAEGYPVASIQQNADAIERSTIIGKYEMANADSDANGGNEICTICRAEYVEGEDIRRLECMHFFHVSCVDDWFSKGKMTCPLCRNICIRN